MGTSVSNLVWEIEKLVIKMMKLGVTKQGAYMIIDQLNDEQIKAGIKSNDILNDIIDVMYYKR